MNKDQEEQYNLRRNAIRKGYEFVELRLQETYHHDTLTPIKVMGVMELHGRPIGIKQGRMQYEMFTKSGGLRFEFNKESACFVAWMVVDKGPGVFSETSYNLDVLTSHSFDNKIFYIHNNPKIKREVTKRAKIMKQSMIERDVKKIAEQAKLEANKTLEIADNLEARRLVLQKEIDKIQLEKDIVAKSSPKKEGAAV